MSEQYISVVKDFARFPGPRHAANGPYSGEEFREKILSPALEKLPSGTKLIVVLDGARGFTASFLEEAFGGLVRVKGMKGDELRQKLDVRATDPSVSYWLHKISEYIQEAEVHH